MPRPSVLLISCGPDSSKYLIEEIWGSLTRAIASKARVARASSVSKTIALLRSSAVYTGILVLDAGYTTHRDRDQVTNLLQQRASNGASVVYGGVFPAVVDPQGFAGVFSRFGVGWRMGSYITGVTSRIAVSHRSTINDFQDQIPWMYPEVEMSMLAVRDVGREHIWYNSDQREVSGAVMARIGRGHVGFVGDREGSDGGKTIILAMLRLLVI